jgi:hypothetical protein
MIRRDLSHRASLSPGIILSKKALKVMLLRHKGALQSLGNLFRKCILNSSDILFAWLKGIEKDCKPELNGFKRCRLLDVMPGTIVDLDRRIKKGDHCRYSTDDL